MKKLIILLFFFSCASLADSFTNQSTFEVCFTPNKTCQQNIIKEIDKAKHSILVQAYSFTDLEISAALKRAATRRVVVQLLLDKTNLNSKNKAIQNLKGSPNILVLCDCKPRIAHNKLIIVDGSIVIGGSYNYTNSAFKSNAENLLIIKDRNLASKYTSNFQQRKGQSVFKK